MIVDSGVGLLLVRIAAGITTGTLAIFSAQPTDVVKVRMQAEVKKQGEKSRYKGVVDAYVTIAKTEGFQGLYKGTFDYMKLMSQYSLLSNISPYALLNCQKFHLRNSAQCRT